VTPIYEGNGHGNAGTITITGGRVNATDGTYGAGIGGGEGGTGGNIWISGGKFTPQATATARG